MLTALNLAGLVVILYVLAFVFRIMAKITIALLLLALLIAIAYVPEVPNVGTHTVQPGAHHGHSHRV